MSAQNHKSNFLLQDIALIFFSIFVAVVLGKNHTLSNILISTKEFQFFGSFISGLFFTSIFTTAPAIVTLGQIAKTGGVLFTAFFGALGAVAGDFLIFLFVRDRLSEHILGILKHQGAGKRIKAWLRLKYFRWFTFFLGGLIIASPFPDELGISLLGLSKMKTKPFIIISFTFNFIGITLIGLAWSL